MGQMISENMVVVVTSVPGLAPKDGPVWDTCEIKSHTDIIRTQNRYCFIDDPTQNKGCAAFFF